MDHQITIERYIPKGQKNAHYIALCSCERWRSNAYREREHAETKGLIHAMEGDDGLRKAAALDHGSPSLRTTYNWYIEQAEDPFTPEEQRQTWQRLADEIAPRVVGSTDEEDIPLF